MMPALALSADSSDPTGPTGDIAPPVGVPATVEETPAAPVAEESAPAEQDDGSGGSGQAPSASSTGKWYIVHSYSNFERRVADAISERAVASGLGDLIEEVLVPIEKVTEMRRGRKIDAERRFFPGYVLVRMDMTDESYHLVKNTPGVSGFLGSGPRPSPVSQSEIDRIVNQVREGIDRPRPSVTFEVGEQVCVSDGPFASFNGLVEEVDEERARLKVTVSIFGRATPVDLEYGQVDKV